MKCSIIEKKIIKHQREVIWKKSFYSLRFIFKFKNITILSIETNVYTQRYFKAFAQSDIFDINQIALDVFDGFFAITLVKQEIQM